MIPPPPRSTLFPYTTLFRSHSAHDHEAAIEFAPPFVCFGSVCNLHFGRTNLAAPAESTLDRKSTRLNSSHVEISYAVFCLKKKNNLLIILISLMYATDGPIY